MTVGPMHRVFGLGVLLVLCAGVSVFGGCSSGSANGETGGGANPGGTPGSGGSTGGTPVAGTTAGDGLSHDGTPNPVGFFTVALAEATPTTPAYTSVGGKVYDGTNPSAYVETSIGSGSGCTVYKLTVPLCDPSCGTDVCVADNTCRSYPASKNVGTVTVSGVATAAGATTITLVSVANSYQFGEDLAYPGFKQGDPIKLSATGGDYTAFEISAQGIAPLTLQTSSPELSKTKALTLTWDSSGASSSGSIWAELNLSHHGGSRGYLECNVADTGSLTIPADLIAKLINLGVAGFPTLTLTRRSEGKANIPPGPVVLRVESSVSRTISVEGSISCLADTDCPTGRTCNQDVKLCR